MTDHVIDWLIDWLMWCDVMWCDWLIWSDPIDRSICEYADGRYNTSTWQLHCVGASAVSCRPNSNQTQGFTVSSSVNFVLIPATPPEPPAVWVLLWRPFVMLDYILYGCLLCISICFGSLKLCVMPLNTPESAEVRYWLTSMIKRF